MAPPGAGGKWRAFAREVVRVVRESLGVSIDCELCPVGTMPRGEGEKLQRVVDLRRSS